MKEREKKVRHSIAYTHTHDAIMGFRLTTPNAPQKHANLINHEVIVALWWMRSC